MQFIYTSLIETVMELLENLNLSEKVNVQIMLPKIEVKTLQIYCQTNNPCYTVYSCISGRNYNETSYNLEFACKK